MANKKSREIHRGIVYVLVIALGTFTVGAYFVWDWLVTDAEEGVVALALMLSILLIPAWLFLGYWVGKTRSLLRIIDLALPDILEYKLGTKEKPQPQTTLVLPPYPAIQHTTHSDESKVIDM